MPNLKLHPKVLEATNRLIHMVNAVVHEEMYVACGIRTPAENFKIYGKERWTLHYIGLAVDLYPRFKTKDNWESKFNKWPHWNYVQTDLSQECGFDKPKPFQLTWDRCHFQTLLSVSESTVRNMWYAYVTGKDTTDPVVLEKARQNVWDYINLHQEKS